MDPLSYTQGPTGPTSIAVLMPTIATRRELWTRAEPTQKAVWYDWSWGLSPRGIVAFHLDLVRASIVMEGDVLDEPVLTELGVEMRRGYAALLCPMCRRGLAKNGLLLARRSRVVEFGCTRCVAPPPNDEAPSPAEVRAALEALSRRATSSDARRGAGRRGGGC